MLLKLVSMLRTHPSKVYLVIHYTQTNIVLYSHFLPDTGPLFSVRTPAASENIRLETGFVQGDNISVHYDPMISKLIVHGQNRNDALRRFRRALEQYQVVGLNTNIGFIKTVAEHPEFIKGEVETGFIQQYEKDLFKDPGAPDPTTLALAASALRLKEIDNIKKSSQGKIRCV
jgi:3-methylcrotonyl-CoA carboxylase alpha subunit